MPVKVNQREAIRKMTDLSKIATWPTTSEAARVLGVSAQMVAVYLNRGLLHFIPTRAGRLIDPDDLLRLKRERESRAAAE